nr:hypothetical protein [Tanacetum cinerariifolium]
MTNNYHLDTPDACQDMVDHIVPPRRGKKGAFKEFKRYKDDRVEQRCAKMDARLDKLSVDFDDELYPHMLTVIAGRHWVIGHGLRLAVMKCAESLELRLAFANVV